MANDKAKIECVESKIASAKTKIEYVGTLRACVGAKMASDMAGNGHAEPLKASAKPFCHAAKALKGCAAPQIECSAPQIAYATPRIEYAEALSHCARALNACAEALSLYARALKATNLQKSGSIQ